MPKIDVGEKQTCPQCGSKFYDLTRRPAVCPKCAFSFDPGDEVFRARRVKARAGAYDPVADDDEELPEREEAAAPEDEEVEAAELEEVADEAPEGTLIDDEDDAVAGEEDDLGEGFSEADVEVEDAEDDDSVPFLEDDDDEFEEEIGDIGGDDEDN